ncbi:MAG: glucosyl-3-phosphoglycerate synthase [Nitriliruptoraceae bacterium]
MATSRPHDDPRGSAGDGAGDLLTPPGTPGGRERPAPGPPVIPHTRYDPAELAARAHAAGKTVSVIIPARDEESTVADVVSTLKGELMDRVGLVDELLVVDAGSRDRTAERARAAGARVVRQADVLSHLGTAPGKGEAMWKGLAAARGDLLVYVDADLTDARPHFVTGLLGPLLHDERIRFTKAVYDRPLGLGETDEPSGGGRVTELLARPILATLFPALAGIVQPLAGEIAARRDLLASVPFVRGYGVEIAMLIDIEARAGIGSIAQVDLGRRSHAHQPLPALSRMSTELLQVALARRAVLDGRASGAPAADGTSGVLLWQPHRTDDGSIAMRPTWVAASERPPLRDVR